MRAFFIGKDPQSQDDDESPTLFATDRTGETTFVVQGWRVTDPEITSKIAGGGCSKSDILIEVPEEVLDMHLQSSQEGMPPPRGF